MFAGQFKRFFEPYHDGYVVYPSFKMGGKFVTAAERDALVADFRCKFRPAALLGLLLYMPLYAVGHRALSQSLDFPAHIGWIDGPVSLLLPCIWMFRIFSAPSRLVRGRPDVTPPRSNAEWRHYHLKNTDWWQIAFMLLVGIVQLYVASTLPEGSTERLFLIGSGCFTLVFEAVQAICKWRHQSA